MAFPEQALFGVFNNRPPGFQDFSFHQGMVRPSQDRENLWPNHHLESQVPANLAGDDLRPFPYADLIREHLSAGRVLAAQKLLEFARDLIPPNSKLIVALAQPRIKKSGRQGVDSSSEFRWLHSNGARFRGQWVALVGETLVGSAATLSELLSELKKNPPPNKPLIHHLD